LSLFSISSFVSLLFSSMPFPYKKNSCFFQFKHLKSVFYFLFQLLSFYFYISLYVSLSFCPTLCSLSSVSRSLSVCLSLFSFSLFVPLSLCFFLLLQKKYFLPL
jgi:hypothetical protein